MYIPDSRWEMPELLTPGRKPVGNFKIDWSNPLTQNLIIAIVPQSGAYQNLVRPTKTVNTVGTFERGALRFNDTNAVDTIPIAPITGKNDHFIMWCGSLDATGWDDEGHLFQTVNATPTANVITILKRAAATRLTAYYGHVVNQHTELVTTLSDMVAENSVLALQHYKSGGSDYRNEYRNGSLIASNTVQNAGTEVSRAEMTINVGTAPYRGKFRMKALFIWEKRVFPVEVARDLTSNPYQFLIPA